MKKSSGKYKPPPLLSVIEAARAGKADAMEQILQHYDAYINKLCLRTMVDESGQTHKQVDPYMKGRLQSKLMVMDDTVIEAIVSMLMDLQDRERTNLPLYEQQLREVETAIKNLLNAIQQGILTKSTKGRLEELEATKEELETKIACEKLAKPKVSAEFMTFWLHRFRKLDVQQKSHRKMLIDTFINAIFLYDDKMVLTFNYKEGTATITFDDLKTAFADQKTGSDLDCSTAP